MNYRWGSSFLLSYFACTKCFTFRPPSLIRSYAKPSKHKDVHDVHDIDEAFMKDADDFYDRDVSKKKEPKEKNKMMFLGIYTNQNQYDRNNMYHT